MSYYCLFFIFIQGLSVNSKCNTKKKTSELVVRFYFIFNSGLTMCNVKVLPSVKSFSFCQQSATWAWTQQTQGCSSTWQHLALGWDVQSAWSLTSVCAPVSRELFVFSMVNFLHLSRWFCTGSDSLPVSSYCKCSLHSGLLKALTFED